MKNTMESQHIAALKRPVLSTRMRPMAWATGNPADWTHHRTPYWTREPRGAMFPVAPQGPARIPGLGAATRHSAGCAPGECPNPIPAPGEEGFRKQPGDARWQASEDTRTMKSQSGTGDNKP